MATSTGELQCTLEICLEVHKFYNVDLFLRGYYQLQLGLRVVNTKIPVRVETTTTTTKTPKKTPPTTPTNNNLTKKFRILFRNEELELKEIFLFRVHFSLDLNSSSITKLIDELNRVEYLLDIKLVFNDQVVSSRTCRVNYFVSGPSLHYYRPVFFDYFHLCAVTLSLHGGVVAVHVSKGTLMNIGGKPDVVPPGSPTTSPQQQKTMETSCMPSSSMFTSQQKLLATAKLTHESIMNILLDANSSLKTKLVEFLQVLGKNELIDGFKSFGFNFGTTVDFTSDDVFLQAHKQIAHLCAENILLWHRFLDLVIGKDPVRVYLANLHHQLRVKRFSEGFYTTTSPPRLAYTSKDYTPIVELLKKSINYTQLPLECIEIDGDCSTIPIIFEDQFENSVESDLCSCKAENEFKNLKEKKVKKKSSTLPRRHSLGARNVRKLEKRFRSTPFLSDAGLDGERSLSGSSESGWGSQSSDGDLFDLLPPPAAFSDAVPLGDATTTPPKVPCACPPQKKQSQSNIPYFLIPDELRIFHPKGLHLIICVHGLDGSCHDLRLFKIYLEVSLPGHSLHFLMSEKNQDGTTFSNFSTMTDKFTTEILNYIESNKLNPARISFVGHSLGNIIIRSALTKPNLAHLLPKLHTFLSLSGPHLGTLYNQGTLVNMGMWLMQKWKKSSSLLQLQLKDHSDIRQTFMYQLSEKSNLEKFKFVLLCGSSQDRYVPVHSAHVINCKASLKDGGSVGSAYRTMVSNILNPILTSPTTKLIRYDVHHAINQTSANSLIGRAAHIAVLDSEIVIEKLLSASVIKYFQ